MRLQKKFDEKSDLRLIMLDKRKGCCSGGCMEKIALEDIVAVRKRVWAKTQKYRQEYLAQAIEAIGETSSRTPFTLNGLQVCRKAWCITHGISETR